MTIMRKPSTLPRTAPNDSRLTIDDARKKKRQDQPMAACLSE
jgi:hypothetical protein